MKESFGLAFLLVGLPSLYVLRDFVPINGKVFTYFFTAIAILMLFNIKNVLNIKFYLLKPILISSTIFVILLLFTTNSIVVHGFNQQSMYLIILMLIYFSFFSIRGIELNDFFKYVLYISSFSVYIAFAFTPTDMAYWQPLNGRFYLGDTENPGLVSVLTTVNILAITMHLIDKKHTISDKVFLYPLFIISPYLYLLSQGKSTIVGIAVVLIFLLIKYYKKITKQYKKLLKTLVFLSVFFALIYSFFYKFVDKFFTDVTSSFLSLLGYQSTVKQMSAEIRNENFIETMNYMSLDNFFGHGINTFRMDSPFLQAAVDLGNILALLLFFIVVIYPLFFLYRIKFTNLDDSTKIVILYFVFAFQGFFFHGTPYEYSLWLPVLIFYKFISSYRYRSCD